MLTSIKTVPMISSPDPFIFLIPMLTIISEKKSRRCQNEKGPCQEVVKNIRCHAAFPEKTQKKTHQAINCPPKIRLKNLTNRLLMPGKKQKMRAI
jgi:hypothetical protein